MFGDHLYCAFKNSLSLVVRAPDKDVFKRTTHPVKKKDLFHFFPQKVLLPQDLNLQHLVSKTVALPTELLGQENFVSVDLLNN